ncbi:MAG: biosynthetic-type acetolactate synthase large subunit [Oscillospiraceae bacterium]|nr:biosynthetic-type acetolactate synthase large subunit [Oscillospiraceae bacterium]
MLNGSEILMELLLEQGVDTVFGYPGGAVLHIYDALYQYSDRIRHVMTAHEQGAAHAADGYARLTGKTGVVLATSGPGATNLVTGIATAYMDSVPLIAITGNVGTGFIGRDSFQEVYIAGITMPITKHNFVVRHAEELAPTLRAAFNIAQEGRKGPVLVDIPKDVSAALCDYAPIALPSHAPDHTITGDIDTALRLLNTAERPLIYFGGGVTSANAGGLLRKLCEKADIPATHTLMAAGVLGCGEAHNLGLIGMHGCVTANHAVHHCDLLVILGARCSDRVALNPASFAPQAKKLHIDIDAAEFQKNIAVDCTLAGDVGVILSTLLPQVAQAQRGTWMEQIQAWRRKDYHPMDDASSLKPHQVMERISALAGKDAIYVTDVGQHQLWAAQYCRHVRPRSFLTSGGLGTMGFGYGASIGAAFGAQNTPNRPIVHITGDGSFHMNLQEACTAVSYAVPIITVIMNNHVLGMVRQWQSAFYAKRYSSTDPQRRTDFVQLAKGFGLPAFRCTDLRGFEGAFAQALTITQSTKQPGPVWIECEIGKDEKVLPMIPAGGSLQDMMMD